MHDALFQSILASPADDMPRLVYADWLDEQGDTPRAEFIRAQIHGNHRRADDLLLQHRSEWVVPGIGGVQTFRRGFVDGLRMAAGEFVQNAERIGGLAPVTDLRLPVAVDHLAALAAVAWLDRVIRLDLTGNVGLGSRLDYFFGLAELPNLQSLELRNCQLWPEHGSTLGRLAERWPKLTRLNLSGNPLGDDGVTRLAGAKSLAKLAELIIRCDEQQSEDAIRNSGAHEISLSQYFSQLRRLDLNGHFIGDYGFVNLLESDLLHQLETLDLGFNGIGHPFEETFSYNMRAHPPRLKKLILDGNDLSDLYVQELLIWLRAGPGMVLSLKEIDFSDATLQLIRVARYNGLKIESDDPRDPFEEPRT